MYCVDTLERLNEEAVRKHREEVESDMVSCDYCTENATHTTPVYNPADAVNGISGVYSIINTCDKCHEDNVMFDEVFMCNNCWKYFITNHSWDDLMVEMDGEFLCHKCAGEELEPMTFLDLKYALHRGDVSDFVRLDNILGKEEVWSGEYSGYSDFSGHTSLDSIVKELDELDIDEYDMVYPVITKTYQFAVVLGVFR